MADEKRVIDASEPVSEWFGLSYASYLTLPRSILEAMPIEWQQRFAGCLGEMDAAFPCLWPPQGKYEVRVRLDNGRYEADPLAAYRRPDRALIEQLKRGREKAARENGRGAKKEKCGTHTEK